MKDKLSKELKEAITIITDILGSMAIQSNTYSEGIWKEIERLEDLVRRLEKFGEVEDGHDK